MERRRRVERPVAAGRAGGVYVPPFRMAAMRASVSNDKSSTEYQRMTWNELRKAINGEGMPDIIRTVRSAGYALDAGN